MKWLHISDLHYNPATINFDTTLLLNKLSEYLDNHNITVDEIFYTGDFRYAKTQSATRENAKLAAKKLMEISIKAGVSDTKRIHIVPGNHDLERGNNDFLEQAYKLYDHGEFSGYIKSNGERIYCADYLSERFQFFHWVAAELDNNIWLDTPVDPVFRYHRSGKIGEKYNIVYLNTALGSGWNSERTNLRVGYEYIFKIFNKLDSRFQTIVIGHHGLGCLVRAEREKIVEIFYQNNVKLYLCGDEHVGGMDEFGDTLQLTAGCLNQLDNGIEPTFYIGDMDEKGSFEIKAYVYQNGVYPGWTLPEPFNDKIHNWTREAFPRNNNNIFDRNVIIQKITTHLKSPQGKIVELWGVAGIGKTTVCHEVLKRIETANITIDARYSNTTISIQREILRNLYIDVDHNNINPNEYASFLLNEAKKIRKTLYLDNAENVILKDKLSFLNWLIEFKQVSGWRIMFSTLIQIDAECIESFELNALPDDDAYNMFVNRRWITESQNDLSENDKLLSWEIAVDLLSKHPLAIYIVTSSRHRKRPLQEIKDKLKKRVNFELADDNDNPHRSMSAALSLTISAIEENEVSIQAKELWSMLAQYPGEFSDDLFSTAYNGKTEYADARLILRDFAIIGETDYKMLEPIKSLADNFTQEEKKTSRSLLYLTLTTIFTRGDNKSSDNLTGDREKWYDISHSCLLSALIMLAEASPDDFYLIRPLVHSLMYYFQFSSFQSLQTLYYLEQLYRTERDNLGLANVLKAMGDLESRLGEIDAAQKHYADAEQLYRTERANLGLANVLQAMGDLERRLGEIDAAINKYLVAYGLYNREQEPMGRVYCLAELCRVYAKKKDELHFREYAKATLEALSYVGKNVVEYAVECVREGMDAFGITQPELY